MNELKIIGKQIEEEIANLQWPKSPHNLYEPIRYILSLGGKRIRPALVLIAERMFSKGKTNALLPAIGIEVFHNFTLLHDDIMDNAEVRRGKDTVHVKWDNNIAILSGDAMMIKANQLMAEAPESVLKEVIKVFNQTALEVCEGQQMDMDFESRMDVRLDEYLEMIRLKTSVLLAGSLQIGALIGNASKQQAESMYECGINLGLAFQLQDDYLDSFGDYDSFGKEIGGDIRENKKTFLLIKALEKSKGSILEALKDSLELESEDKVNKVLKIYKDLGLDTLIMSEVKSYSNKARSILLELNVDLALKKPLFELLDYLENRNL